MGRRRRRGRFADRTSVGRSEIVPYIAGEGAARRHVRRLRTNLASVEDVLAWSVSAGLTFRCTNHGEHWQRTDGTRRVEWWPRTAKLVKDKRWADGIHVHDFEQAMRIVCEHFSLEISDAPPDA